MPDKILIVDDEEDLVEMLTFRLRAADYDVVSARDGREGLEKAKTEKPDLIILDVMMPKMDGYHVCRTLKSDNAYKNIPIIMLTAKVLDGDKKAGEIAGADDYITKPFDGGELLAKIKKLLG